MTIPPHPTANDEPPAPVPARRRNLIIVAMVLALGVMVTVHLIVSR
jgi:hypothetical protein